MTPRRRRGRVSEAPAPPYATRPAARLLIDTHIFIWWAAADAKLEPAIRDAIEGAREVFLSVASAWELGIKAQLRKLHAPPDALRPAELLRRGVIPLSITMEHALAAAALPPLHRDPFDRMVVAQARLEGLTLVTADATLARYDVPVMQARA